MTAKTENSSDSRITMTLTRRGFVKMGGALFVSLSIPGGLSLHAAESPTSLDPSVLAFFRFAGEPSSLSSSILMSQSIKEAQQLR
jgi:hypothetical protein